MFLLHAQAQRLASVAAGVAKNLAVVLNQAGEQKRLKE
jgi:hypothetical protein